MHFTPQKCIARRSGLHDKHSPAVPINAHQLLSCMAANKAFKQPTRTDFWSVFWFSCRLASRLSQIALGRSSLWAGKTLADGLGFRAEGLFGLCSSGSLSNSCHQSGERDRDVVTFYPVDIEAFYHELRPGRWFFKRGDDRLSATCHQNEPQSIAANRKQVYARDCI